MRFPNLSGRQMKRRDATQQMQLTASVHRRLAVESMEFIKFSLKRMKIVKERANDDGQEENHKQQ
jgi:hypothetical protein